MARTAKLKIQLSASDREQCESFVRTGKHAARSINRVRILLCWDDGLSVNDIHDRLGASVPTIYNVCHRYQSGGLTGVIEDRPKSGAPPKIVGKVEATLIALACSKAPDGYEHWTMQMLADKLVSLQLVDEVSDETVRQHLKKVKSSPGKKTNGVSGS